MGGTGLDPREARARLYDIVRSDAPFEEKAQEALDLGRRYLGADNGHLTRIDTELSHWEAITSTDTADGQFPPGLELDLDTTYCRHTVDTDQPIALHDAPAQGWAEDPAFETHGLHRYHGTVLRVDGDSYGTVCFVAEEPRDEPYADGETMFAELVTRSLERELEREHHEAQLLRQTNLATVLNRVLRHNLRNDMTVIRGYTQMIRDTLEDDSRCQTILDNVDDLIALSQKARELERFVAEDVERHPTDLVSLAERVVERVGPEYPAATVSVTAQRDVTADVLPRFERVVEELVENAAKHGGDSPTVTVAVGAEPNAATVRISDDGPGLPEHEREVIEAGAETPLVHGTGLGLWLAHWIVTSHNGSLEATVDEGGTTVTVSIPRVPEATLDEQLTEIQRVQDRYENAFEEAADAMVLVDDDARIVDANREAPRVYGTDRADLLGRAIPEFLPDDAGFESTWETVQTAGAGRDAVTIVGADGETRPVEYSATSDVVPGQHLFVVRELPHRIS